MADVMDDLSPSPAADRPIRLANAETWGAVPGGYDALVFAQHVRDHPDTAHVFVARDHSRLNSFQEALAFFAPNLQPIVLPSWDCLPYDRVGPSPGVAAARASALTRLAHHQNAPLVLTTVAALTQRVPPPQMMGQHSQQFKIGEDIDFADLETWLLANGYQKASTVIEPGEYAIRGGVIDLYPPGAEAPVRLDCFGETLESLRRFDPMTQRTTESVTDLALSPASELLLFPEMVSNFRSEWLRRFGVTAGDPTYAAISAGQRHQGAEHLLPLFCQGAVSVLSYLPGRPSVVLDAQAESAAQDRLAQIEDYHQARVAALAEGQTFRGVAPDELYWSRAEFEALAEVASPIRLSPLVEPKAQDKGARLGRSFAAERSQDNAKVFEAVVAYIEEGREHDKRVMVTASSEGSAERLGLMLMDHGLEGITPVDNWQAVEVLPKPSVARAVFPLDQGFETPDLRVISETDILGERLNRKRPRRRASNFIAEAASLTAGDLIVHIDHGVGRYLGLKTLEVTGAPHDCLELLYAEEAKLYLPVENIDLLSRYGAESDGVKLDRLGGASWQSRKAKAKQRLKDMAEGLIKIAAERALRQTEPLDSPGGAFDEFCARFPYEETDDQLHAIADVVGDLSSRTPMDRLICGDVGFGKTEVALRAAFVAALSGRQVAVICPTTLLARQHFQTFQQRFQGWPLKVRMLSRLVTNKDAKATREGLTGGTVDIVIGTHALLSDKVKFDRLGLVIVDEEQHFGVKHKERLKSFRADVHVLTLTATPIPRTLQLSLAGIREMSIIATPPVDRLAVRTYTAAFDAVMVREALLREKYRGGQSYFVVPRIADLGFLEEFLRTQVPEISFMTAHGQMAPTALEDIMSDFVDGKFDVLLSTTIVESGLDIPAANTLIIHKAEQFGLAQLYQLRGRVGRSKQRAYAYLTTNPKKALTEGAERRLKVLQSLDSLGAGFQLASHDLDIRGGGNLLGEEQSGHIREVGVELYQQMLEDAVTELKAGGGPVADTGWSPQINLGLSVMIPESYVPDLNVRLSLYRRLSEAEDGSDREALAAELIDRFGPLPPETASLVRIVGLKALCRKAQVAKIEAGPKGAVLSFRNQSFPNPGGLVQLVSKHPERYKLRPDMSLVIKGTWPKPEHRLTSLEGLLGTIAELAGL